jgi:preprotein translocase subunit SecG
MHTILLVIHIIIAVSMIGVILVQRNDSDGLGGLSGGGGGGSFLSGRASANILTRITAILAAAFMINSMVLAKLSAQDGAAHKSLLDAPQAQGPAEAGKPAATPAAPAKPSVPVAQ